ncbi:hypothetical protein XENOCAPTIV_016214 [Xenoophorus captivus]|uniref:Uncharacterized protein n=1 Tax=Xenoophorus captivus TaxID=1517983 RepID=A0ABV0QS53_9TELE
MSRFNLDRFRFEKKITNKDPRCVSKSPDSEKENEPESIRRRLAVKSRPAQLKSRSHAAEAVRAVFSLRESFLMAVKECSSSMVSVAQAR